MAFPVIEVSIQREYMLILRDGLLKQVDAIERMLAISPRTSELRREMKAAASVVESEERKEGSNEH
jgi:hypothetical protein